MDYVGNQARAQREDEAERGGGLDIAALYERHRADLLRYVARTFGSGPPEPEDVVQASFARFLDLPDPEAVENPMGFLVQSARNHVLDHRRRRKVRQRFATSPDAHRIVESVDGLHATRVIEGKEALEIVDAAVGKLSKRQRGVFLLHRVHGLSYAEIARRTGWPETTIKRHTREATQACLVALRDAGFSED